MKKVYAILLAVVAGVVLFGAGAVAYLSYAGYGILPLSNNTADDDNVVVPVYSVLVGDSGGVVKEDVPIVSSKPFQAPIRNSDGPVLCDQVIYCVDEETRETYEVCAPLGYPESGEDVCDR